jgi:hypothetical protein
METLFPLLVIAAIAFFIVKAVSKASAQARETRVQELRRADVDPDYVFEGRYYVNLNEASDAGGDHGLKFAIALFRPQRIMRVRFYRDNSTFDIRFSDISDVQRIVFPGGVYGTYPSQLIAIDLDSEDFPFRQILGYPGHYAVLDELKTAVG